MTVIHFEPFSEVLPFFTTPPNSSDIACILLVSGLNNRVQMANLSEITCKYVMLPYKGKFVLVPLLH